MISFSSVLDAVFKQNQNVKREMQPKKHRRAATWGPFKTMYTCRQSSARQHRSTRAASIHDDISTPGDRWASHGGGGASHVDAPGSNFRLFPYRTRYPVLKTNFQLHSRGRHAEIISNSLRFASHAGKQSPENVGAVGVVRLLAICRRSV